AFARRCVIADEVDPRPDAVDDPLQRAENELLVAGKLRDASDVEALGRREPRQRLPLRPADSGWWRRDGERLPDYRCRDSEAAGCEHRTSARATPLGEINVGTGPAHHKRFLRGATDDRDDPGSCMHTAR